MGFDQRSREGSGWGFSSPQGKQMGFPPAQGPRRHPLVANLAFWLEFDDDSGLAFDSVSGLSLTEINSPDNQGGVIDQSITLSRVTDSGMSSTNANFYNSGENNTGSEGTTVSQPFTAAMWIRVRSTGGYAWGVVACSKWDDGGSDQDNWVIEIHPISAGVGGTDPFKVEAGVRGNGGSLKWASTDTDYGRAGGFGDWMFVALRYFGTSHYTGSAGSGTWEPGDAGSHDSTDREYNASYSEIQCIVVDSTGIDVIAYNAAAGEAMQPGNKFLLGLGTIPFQGDIDLLGYWDGRLLSNDELVELHDLGASNTDYPWEKSNPVNVQKSLRNWWKFDDAGTWADSVSGISFWTENNSPATTTGKINDGIDFAYTGGFSGPSLTATNALLDVGDGTAVGDLSMTMTAWVYQDVGIGDRGKSFAQWLYGFYLNTGHPGGVYTLRTNFYAQVGAWLGDSILSTPTVQTGEWNFVFCRYYNLTDTPTAGAISYHCGIVNGDGIHTSTPVTGVGKYKGNTGECTLNVGGYELQGTLDLLGIWMRPLTDNELISVYTTTNALTDYPF